ncbi:MAG: lipoprotein insertase outer membrane protein LolB [Spongiibacteraceae bacterium]
MNNRVAATTLLVLLVLSGCATQSFSPDENNWRLQAKIGLWQGEQQESAYLDWQQCGEHQTIRVSGPLGAGSLVIQNNAQGASLSHQGKQQHADDIELLASNAGWPMPIRALRYWLRGHAAPNATQTSEMSSDGQLLHLQQLGWNIAFSDYQYVSLNALPMRITATSGELKLRLIARNWNAVTANCTP